MNLTDNELVGGERRDRGRPMQVRQWWLDLANEHAHAWKKENSGGLIGLGIALAKKVERTEDWNHGTVSKLLRGKLITDEIVDAFCRMFDMPRPVYYPRTLTEALAFKKAAEAEEKPSRVQARGRYDQAMSSMETAQSGSPKKSGQSAAVKEENEQPEPPELRRPRGVGAHRKSPR